jgi:hypothetical protein
MRRFARAVLTDAGPSVFGDHGRSSLPHCSWVGGWSRSDRGNGLHSCTWGGISAAHGRGGVARVPGVALEVTVDRLRSARLPQVRGEGSLCGNIGRRPAETLHHDAALAVRRVGAVFDRGLEVAFCVGHGAEGVRVRKRAVIR